MKKHIEAQTVSDLLEALKGLPPKAKLATNHNDTIYVEDAVRKWRPVFKFEKEK